RTAYREPFALVLGTHTIEAQGSEAGAVQSIAATVAGLLADAGIRTSTIGDGDVERGALADYEFAIFAYNPDMTQAGVDAIREYVESGGRVMFFYQLPGDLGEILGVRRLGSQRAEYDGQLSEIRFEDPEDFDGMPRSVEQSSWMLTVAEPTGDGEVIAWWHDAQGEPTGLPAFIASDAGVWMSHVLTNTSRAAKQRMLVSMLGRYVPEIWPQVAENALEGLDRIGHIGGIEEALAWIEQQAADAPDPAVIERIIAEHRDLLADARASLEAEQYPSAVDTAGEAWDRLRDAYLLAHTPRDAEFRAWWEHSGTGAFDTWEESVQNLADNGFNAIVPNMLWGGVALYDSEHLPHHPVVAERGDQIAECVEAAKRHGIEVHPWKVNWRLGSAVPEEFVQQLREEGRLQRSFAGEEMEWLCPSDPRNLELELNTMVEVARNYDVDGVHFDYIRYPGTQSCYCDGCHERFERDTGLTVENWPEDLRTDEFEDAWTQWRCDQISALVEATAREVRAIKPHVKISAAVFNSYPQTRSSIGQDWLHWVEQGWLDFLCPMDYTNSDGTFATLVARQVQQVAGRVPLYPGIGASASRSTLSVDRVAGQAQIARILGADGFTIFNYSRDMAQNVAPGLGRALLSEEAVHPHNAPPFEFTLDGELTRQRVFGLHVERGARVSGTVARGASLEGRDFGEVTGRIVLQDATGHTVEDFADAPRPGDDPVAVEFTAPEGMHRLAVVGEFERANEQRRRFVTRGLPIVAGGVPADLDGIL
ncbi:MAG: glycoside hydrolase family 10 protein, partial [Armatimonadota bacterium]